MKSTVLKTLALTALTCVTLAACGGGGGGGSGSNNSSSTPTSPGGSGTDNGSSTNNFSPPTACTATPAYAGRNTPTDQTDFLGLLNGWGQNGWRYLGNNSFAGGSILFATTATTFTAADDACAVQTGNIDANIGSISLDGGLLSGNGTSAVSLNYFGTTPVTSSLFEQDGGNYGYAITAVPASAADFVSQLNTQGQAGYLYQGEITLAGTPSLLFRKDGSTATYTYTSGAGVTSAAALAAQANASGYGPAGYLYIGTVTVNSTTITLYAKNSASAATYAYDGSQSAPASASDFVTQANAEGQNGYRAWSAFGTNTTVIYVKDQTQSSTFAFAAPQPQQTTTGGFVWQSNTLGDAYYADLTLGGTTNSFYFQAQSCSGPLCSTATFNPLSLGT